MTGGPWPQPGTGTPATASAAAVTDASMRAAKRGRRAAVSEFSKEFITISLSLDPSRILVALFPHRPVNGRKDYHAGTKCAPRDGLLAGVLGRYCESAPIASITCVNHAKLVLALSPPASPPTLAARNLPNAATAGRVFFTNSEGLR